jgi:hypothetical protein
MPLLLVVVRLQERRVGLQWALVGMVEEVQMHEIFSGRWGFPVDKPVQVRYNRLR